MSYAFDSRFGAQLYHLLPEVYRTRDRSGNLSGGNLTSEDLARYLDAHGQLLDLIHATLEQQLKDTLPETSQDWLLPYFAQLLAVNIVSPDSGGKHAEVANAVSWRQRKGTLKVAEEIAEAVGQIEVEIQEGWKRVAMTPRVGMPLMPVSAWDDTLQLDMTIPSQASRHPSLPATMVDLRRPSRAVGALATNPAARLSNFGGIEQSWRQWNRHGVPCFPDGFDDVSRRTADIRSPDAGNGLCHHKRLLAYTPPPSGLIPFDPLELSWAELHQSRYRHLIEEKEENGVWIIRNKSDRIVAISDAVTLSPARTYRVEGFNFEVKLTVDNGGRLELHRVEAAEVQVDTFSDLEPVLIAEDCLFDELSVGSGSARLSNCSILGEAFLTDIDALDCIFMDMTGTLISGLLQYSRIPPSPPVDPDNMTIEDCSSDEPVFFKGQSVLAARAVLAPDTPPSIYQGASDAGEMGGFHRGRENRPARISGNFSGATALTLPLSGAYPLADVIFEGNVEVVSGHLELRRAVAKSLTLNGVLKLDENGVAIPALVAIDCLFDQFSVTRSMARLEYCAVMRAANCKQLQASDCIFIGVITDGGGSEPKSGCLRYSRIPEGFNGARLHVGTGISSTNTRAAPVFARFDFCTEDGVEYRSAEFGEPGYGVLDPATPAAIRFGAEDGGEMGSCHHKYYSLKAEAVLNKMREFLPVGIDPVLIQDRRLLRVPPQTVNLSNGGTS